MSRFPFILAAVAIGASLALQPPVDVVFVAGSIVVAPVPGVARQGI